MKPSVIAFHVIINLIALILTSAVFFGVLFGVHRLCIKLGLPDAVEFVGEIVITLVFGKILEGMFEDDENSAPFVGIVIGALAGAIAFLVYIFKYVR